MNAPRTFTAALPPGDYLIGDPDAPELAEFVRGELLRGTIRTIPAGRGRILIVPSDAWGAGRPGGHP